MKIKVINNKMQIVGIITKKGIKYLKSGEYFEEDEQNLDLAYLQKLKITYKRINEASVDNVVHTAEAKITTLKKKMKSKIKEEDNYAS